MTIIKANTPSGKQIQILMSEEEFIDITAKVMKTCIGEQLTIMTVVIAISKDESHRRSLVSNMRERMPKDDPSAQLICAGLETTLGLDEE